MKYTQFYSMKHFRNMYLMHTHTHTHACERNYHEILNRKYRRFTSSTATQHSTTQQAEMSWIADRSSRTIDTALGRLFNLAQTETSF